LAPFPYTHNYLQLLAAEVALLDQRPVPVLLRDRELFALSPAARQSFRSERDKLRAFAAVSSQASAEQTIAVCGCGPLPISGLLLHTWTGARVLLIDRDPSSIDAARAWVHELERLSVLEAGAVRVLNADVSQLEFATTDAAARSGGPTRLRCDVMLVASLVDHAAKLRLARRLRVAADGAPHTLLLRSATALCAELAYEPVDTGAINHLRLPFCGESLPSNQVCAGVDAESAARRGVPAAASSELLVLAHRNVLNSTEVYRRLALSDAQLSELAALEQLMVAAHAARSPSDRQPEPHPL
jgi:hypothetical protein